MVGWVYEWEKNKYPTNNHSSDFNNVRSPLNYLYAIYMTMRHIRLWKYGTNDKYENQFLFFLCLKWFDVNPNLIDDVKIVKLNTFT